MLSKDIKKYYMLLDPPDHDIFLVKIIKGKFSNVVYHYGRVSFDEPDADGNPLNVKYTYTMVDNPTGKDLSNTRKFISLMDYILNDILIDDFVLEKPRDMKKLQAAEIASEDLG